MTYQKYQPVVVAKDVLTVEERAALVAHFEASEDQAADQEDTRIHQRNLQLPQAEWPDLQRKVIQMLHDTNDRYYHFDLADELNGQLRIVKYLPGYWVDWHIDYGDHDNTEGWIQYDKLTTSILLTSGYRGGEFEVLDYPSPEPEAGDAVVFPAFTGHKVNPVTAGVRYVLLAWIGGPRFR